MEQIWEFVGRHPLLTGGFAAVLAMLVWTEIARRFQAFAEVTPAQAVPLINTGDITVVDLSSAKDFNRGHIVGARNIPPSRFDKPDKEVQKLAGRKVLVVDRNGQTAPRVANALKRIGAEDVSVLKGGMVQWQSEQFPVTRQ